MTAIRLGAGPLCHGHAHRPCARHQPCGRWTCWRGCDLIAAEDTRVTAKLLAIHGIARPLTAYNDHNAARERPRLLEKLKAGARIALVSDAGTPLVSDPGFKLVRAAIEEGIAGPCRARRIAVLAGLVLSGLPSDRFLFAGFLSAKAGERQHGAGGTEKRARHFDLFRIRPAPGGKPGGRWRRFWARAPPRWRAK